MLPVGLIFWRTFENGIGRCGSAHRPGGPARVPGHAAIVAFWAVLLNTIFGIGAADPARAPRLPGQAVSEPAHRPAARGVAGGGRSRADPRLRASTADRRLARRPRRQSHLRHARHGARHRVRLAAARGARVVRRCSRRSATSRSRPRRPSAPSRSQTFRRVTLPAIRWALAYGIVLTLARCARRVRRGRRRVGPTSIGKTQTATLLRRGALPELRPGHGAYAVAFALAIVAILTLLLINVLRRRSTPDGHPRPQRQQALRRLRRARRRVGRHPDRVAHRAARSERRRQVDAAAGHRRPRDSPTPASSRSTASDATDLAAAAAQRRLRVPALRRVQAHDRASATSRSASRSASGPKAEIASPGRRAARARAPRAVRRPVPVAALRRAAPAHGPGPGPRGRAEGAAARRAVRRARRPGAQGAARPGCAACTTRCT